MIKIGTRDSKLALWQAHEVASKLSDLGFESEIVKIKSQGDLILDKPLHELGITGVFTKNLDVALLQGEIDIAVHSMKDVPTVLPFGISQFAVLKRADVSDVMVLGKDKDSKIVATGSLRRKAFFLNKYPEIEVVDLRGNVQTRLSKLDKNNWKGAVFAKAGLDRLGICNELKLENLDWMIPAPAQGVVMIVGVSENTELKNILSKINDKNAQIVSKIERDFLNKLEGGCTAPIGAFTKIEKDKIILEVAVLSVDGVDKIHLKKECALSKCDNFGVEIAELVLENGGREIMDKIKLSLK